MNHFFKTLTFLGCALGAITAANTGCTITVPGLGLADAGSTTTTTTNDDGGSGTPPTGSADAGTPDEGYDASLPLSGMDSGPEPLGAPDSGLPPGCPEPIAASSIPIWKAPVTSTTACNAADITALTAALGTATTYQALYDAIPSATCKSCVFSSQSDANYQVLVWSPNQAADSVLENFGACYATVSAPCGQPGFALDSCGNAACPATCGDAAACQAKAVGAGGTCATEAASYQSECTALTTVQSKCDTFVDAVKVVCGGT